MKIMFKIICVILSIAIIPVAIKSNATFTDENYKRYCSATLDDNFVDNQIIIVVMPFANFVEYTTDSFSDIECIDLKELTYEISQNKLCRIILLTLNEHSKQYVLDSIKILENRDDVYSAEPNYIESLCEDFTEEENPELIPNDEYYLFDNQ